MREIKFRAWMKGKFGGMAHALEIRFDNYKPSRVVCSYIADGDRYQQITLPKEDVILMQYTGYKDKNGKEIYEGDVVWAYYDPVEDGKWYNLPMEIVWDEGGFIADSRRVVAGSIESGPFEVIGNIFENPELIKPLSDKEKTRLVLQLQKEIEYKRKEIFKEEM